MNLRNYQVDGQLGMEPTVAEWVDNLVAVLDEIARVLKDTGSIWLNVGDSYSRHVRFGAPPKGLLLAPERLLVALADRGWRVRNKVAWCKPNGRPSPVKDRLTASWEPVYLLTRSRSPFFDLDPIRVPHRSQARGTAAEVPRAIPTWQGPLAGKNDGLAKLRAEGRVGHRLGGNPRDTWTIPASNYRGAHFATFPEALVERPLLATCPERVCTSCGLPWWRAPHNTIGHLAVMGELQPGCTCRASHRPGIVLDPFLGAGTTALVAERLGRAWLGIELNPDFAHQARQRLARAERASPAA
jgi:site-specific DNA-methyltransferase (adenine-specific)